MLGGWVGEVVDGGLADGWVGRGLAGAGWEPSDAYSLALLLAAVVGLSSASSPQDTGHWDREVRRASLACFTRKKQKQTQRKGCWGAQTDWRGA